MDEKEFERRMVFAREEVAKVRCKENTSGKVMDAVLAEEFAKVLVKQMYAPHLGCATTGELLDEIKTRVEVAGLLGYTTIAEGI